MSASLKTEQGPTYSIAHAGAWKDLAQHVFAHPVLGNVAGKLFLQDPLHLTGMEISFGAIPPGRGTPFAHRHRENEEVYIFVKGSGEFMVDGHILEVREGTVIRVACEGARAWRNTASEPLVYFVIQAKAGTMYSGIITDGITVSSEVRWPD